MYCLPCPTIKFALPLFHSKKKIKPTKKMKESVHFQQIEALNIGHFSKLTIVRYNIICHLLITSNDETHVFLNEQGKPKEYRHAWQIKDWLIENFKISEDQIEYRLDT